MQRRHHARIALMGLVLLGASAAAPAHAHGKGKGHPAPVIQPVTPGYGGVGHGPRYGPTRQVWVPGAWVHETRRTWVPGRSERVWQPPRFETRFDFCGRAFQVQVSAGHWTTIHHPGYWQEQTVRVWRPGHWQTVRRCPPRDAYTQLPLPTSSAG